LGAAAIEALALVWYALGHGALYYAAELETPTEFQDRDARFAHQFHPYFGFSVAPGVPIRRFVTRGELRGLPDTLDARGWLDLSSNNFGFYAPLDYPAGSNAYAVGIFGGSVAHSFAMRAGPYLARRLAARRETADREVVVLNFGSGSYKQPQQALILAYFLTIGQHFDLIVNIDGFNEVALGPINSAHGADPSFPSVQVMRGLSALAQPDQHPESLRRLADLAEIGQRIPVLEARQSRARLAAGYLWTELRLRRLQSRQAELSTLTLDRHDAAALVAAPKFSAGDPDERAGALWERGSRQMAALASASGARYLHVLQPNQYASERVFDATERRIALNPRSPYARHVADGYPLLRARAASLRGAGVDFHDASGLFDAVPEPIYIDDCCHYNQRGYELLADFIAERVPREVP
jgi:hypothetical protein